MTLACLCLGAGPAAAFTIGTSVTRACHEEMTLGGLSTALWPLGRSAPPPDGDDQALAQNLPFEVPPQTDRWSLAMLLGNRDNDTDGHSLVDLPETSAVQNSSADQAAHCLRSPSQDFAEGDLAALVDCRAFIEAQLELAIGPGAEPDLDAVEQVSMSLRFQEIRLPLSRYAFHVGKALHALQDSFSHSFRQGSTPKVLSVFNYLDSALSPHFDERRDGYAHQSELDRCDGADAASRLRVDLARAATVALLEALSAPAASRSDRVAAVLDAALSYQPGCDSHNGWCGSVAALAGDPPGEATGEGCASISGGGPLALAALAMMLRRTARQ